MSARPFILFLLVFLVACGPATLVTPTTPQATPTAANLTLPTPSAAPQLVGQSPLSGEQLALSPVLELTFNVPMDRASVEKAWQFLDEKGRRVNGAFSWKDERTVQFRPAQLRPGGIYTLTITTEAQSQDGHPLAEAIRSVYHTTAALQVAQVFPANGADEVEPTTALTLIFNKPVVALSPEDAAENLPTPVTFEPPIAGQGRWMSASVYVFQPDHPLPGGQTYRGRVAAGLQDFAGATLEEDFTWEFRVRPLRLANVEFSGTSYDESAEAWLNVPLDSNITLTFDRPLERVTLPPAVSIQDKNGRRIPFSLKWNEAADTVTIKPLSRYTLGEEHILRIGEELRAQDGSILESPVTFRFVSLPAPAVISAWPEAKESGYFPDFMLTFNTRMHKDSLINRIQVTPRPPNLNFFYDEWNYTLYIYGFEPGITYQIRLLSGARDIYGNAISQEYVYTRKNGLLPPYANLATYSPTQPVIFRSGVKQGFYLDYTNLDTLHFSLYSLTPAELYRFVSYTVPITNWLTSKSPIRTWTMNVEKVGTSSQRLFISLEERGKLPPGLYLLGVRSPAVKTPDRFASATLFIVSDEVLTLKSAPGEALAWLIDAASGTPIADVTVKFYGTDFKSLGEARTDRQGLASIQTEEQANIAYAASEDGRHIAFITNYWEWSYPSQFGIYREYEMRVSRPMAFVYTERPIYRPGQEVYFKGIVRMEDDLHYALPTQIPTVTVVISNEDGKLYQQTFSLSPLGTFSGSYTLSEDAPVGNYTLQVFRGEVTSSTVPGQVTDTLVSASGGSTEEEQIGSVYFRVAAYVKPRFRLTLQAEPNRLISGETATFRLNAAYYAGGNLAQAPVEWFLESAPGEYIPPENYNQYSFADWEESPRCAYGYPCGPAVPPTSRQGRGQTDDQGNFEHQETFTLPQGVNALRYTFNVDVKDIGGNVVGGYTTATVYAAQVFPGVRTESYWAEQGKPITTQLVALDLQGQPVPKQSLTIALYELRWSNVQRLDERGIAIWESSVERILRDSTTATTDREGKAQVTLTPPGPGEYKIVVSAADAHGRSTRASTYVWVAGREMSLQRTEGTLKIIADRTAYNPGDTAAILVVSPFAGEVPALLTLERGRIYERKLIRLQPGANTLNLPITSPMAPLMYLSVVAIQPAQGEQAPQQALGLASLRVAPSQQQISVQIESDVRIAQPRQSVTFTVTTRDVHGQPVSADVSLALVDKAVLALAAPNSPPLIQGFYPNRGLSVITVTSAPLDAAILSAALDSGRGGSGGGEKGSDQFGIITVRGEFKDTAFWQGQVITDANGQAQVTVTLPDNLTTWQMTARAVTADTRVGEATLELLSTRPLQIDLQTPRFFVAEDEVTLGASIHNNTDQELTVTVTLEAQGFELQEAAEKSLRVPAQHQAYVTWRGRVSAEATRVDLIGRVRGGGYEDATRPTLGTLPGQGLPVLRYLTREIVGTSGLLLNEGSITQSLVLPAGVQPKQSTLVLEISPSLIASSLKDLEVLRDFPYACAEQTVSRFLPNLFLRPILREKGEEERLSQTEREILQAIQRLIRTQNADGGWSLWPGGKSEVRVTAYVLWGLSKAHAEGYTIPEGTLNRASDFLKENIRTVSSSSPFWRKNEVAFATFVLAQRGEAPTDVLLRLYRERAALSLYARALLLEAFHSINPSDERVKTLLSDLSSAAVQSAAGAHWEETQADYWNWNTDLRTTAIILHALMEVQPDHPFIPQGLRWLVNQRRPQGWYSTQETTWSLLAMGRWLEISHELQSDYQFAIGLNGQLQESHIVTPQTLYDRLSLRFSGDEFPQGVGYFSIVRSSGPGALSYTAYMEYALPVEQVHAQDHGFLIQREYFRLDNLKKPITSATRGDLIQVRLTIVIPKDRYYVLVEDPLPAGLEPIDATLLTAPQVPQRFLVNDYNLSGWGSWYFGYRQIYDDRVLFTADYLPAGTYVLTYLARAGLNGTFHVLPANAREFYFPDVSGRSNGLLFTVSGD